MKKLTETFNEISVKKGELFALELPELAGAGYLWDVTVGTGRATLLGTDNRALGRPDAVGGPTLTTRVYRADETGDIRLRAVQERPWEKGKVSPRDVKHFKVKVG